MIMRPGQQLLLPANPVFIWVSLLMALLLNMVQNMGLWGRAAWTPDLLALVLVFWSVHQPLRVGIGIAFAFGLMMDVHQSSLLGQHALAYTALSFLAIAIHRGCCGSACRRRPCRFFRCSWRLTLLNCLCAW
jgi:rod shape-determining protein MreD